MITATDLIVKGSVHPFWGVSQVVLVVKNLLPNAEDIRDVVSVPGLGRFPGGRDGNPLQYSCAEDPMDRGAWRATVHGVAKSRTWLKQLSTHTCTSSGRWFSKPKWFLEKSAQKWMSTMQLAAVTTLRNLKFVFSYVKFKNKIKLKK